MKTVLKNSITIYNLPKVAVQFKDLVKEFAELWENTRETIDIPEKEWMQI